MSRKYQPLSERATAQYGEDVVELDLERMDEFDRVRNGELEIVPSRYEVLVDNFAPADKGSEYEASLYADVEDALIRGGVLKPVADKPEEKPPPKKAAKKSSKD